MIVENVEVITCDTEEVWLEENGNDDVFDILSCDIYFRDHTQLQEPLFFKEIIIEDEILEDYDGVLLSRDYYLRKDVPNKCIIYNKERLHCKNNYQLEDFLEEFGGE